MRRYFAAGVIALVAAVPLFGSLVTTDIYVISQDDPVFEDVYVASSRTVIDGLLDGDLTAFTGELVISGEVTGDVQVMTTGSVRITPTGVIGGSLRGASMNTTIEGEVVGDVFVAGASVVVEEGGMVGRDVMAFGGVARIEGTVGRDVRGRSIRTVITGAISGDVDVATERFEVGPTAVIDGDILYRSGSEASIAADAEVGGTVTRLPAQANFIYGLVLSIANLVGILAFLFAGIVALMVFRGTGSRAVGAIIMHPIRTILYGLATVIVLPTLIVVLGATLVGIPIAVFLAMLGAAALVLGPVPAVTALGNRIMFGRGGLLGAFVLGAVIWRFGIWIVPVVGGALYLVALVWGIGAWVDGAIATRRKDPLPLALLPASMIPGPDEVPGDWVPPMAPVPTPAVEPPDSESAG